MRPGEEKTERKDKGPHSWTNLINGGSFGQASSPGVCKIGRDGTVIWTGGEGEGTELSVTGIHHVDVGEAGRLWTPGHTVRVRVCVSTSPVQPSVIVFLNFLLH